MKKSTLKKWIATLALMSLFSSTVVYGATSYYYSFYLSPTQDGYSSLQVKESSGNAKIQQQSTGTVIQYTVVNSYNTAKSSTVTVYNVDTRYIPYNDGVDAGDYLKLKAYNYPADNAGGVRTATGYWTP